MHAVPCDAHLGAVTVEAAQGASTLPSSQCAPGLAEAAKGVPVAEMMPTQVTSRPVAAESCADEAWLSYMGVAFLS